MEDILATQRQLIEAINGLHSNFKKDGAERKTSDYLRRRLATLEQYYTEFHNNHMTLLSFGDKSHTYFSTNQYDQITEKYKLIKSTIESYTPLANRPQTPVLKPPTFEPTKSQTSNINVASTSTPTATKISLHDGNEIESRFKKQATNFKAFLRTTSNIDLDLVSEKWEFEDILKTLQSRWEAIDSLHWELDNEYGGSNPEYEEQFTHYEKYFQQIKKDINKKMWSLAHIEKSTPKMEIGTFEGNYNKWVSFKDLFTEAVHNNPSLSNAQKMQFLKSKIRGEPEKLIQHLQISSDNYPICWNILNHRYNNKRLIFTSYLNNMLYIPVSQQQSSNHIKRIHDTAFESVNAIKNMGVDVTSWDPFLVCILSQKLDSDTYEDYLQALKSPRELPVLEDFLNFLETKFMMLETSRKKIENSILKTSQSQMNSKPIFSKSPNKYPNKNPKTNYSTNQVSQSSKSKRKTSYRKQCIICNSNDHRIHTCQKLMELQPYERKNTITNLKLCTNCLHYHDGKKCLSEIRCKECNSEHNTILHDAFAPHRSGSNAATISKTPSHQLQQDNDKVASLRKEPSEILLATAIIEVQAVDGSYQKMRVLLDQGSQTSIIRESAAQLLKLPRRRCHGYISGIGNKENNCKGKITIKCSSLVNDFTFETEVYIMNKLINNLPSYTLPKPDWPVINQITLADPEFYKSRPIDILFGADVYSTILMDGICRSEGTLPIAQQTQLGWILSGNYRTYHCNVVLNNIEEIQRFWETEDIYETSTISEEDQKCIEFYQSSTSRREDGSYVVKIPFKENFLEKIGESKTKSIAQFFQIERKLNKQPALARDYKTFISEYLELGHMTPVTPHELPGCYLSHHCVQRAESSTTKLRVVFNASAKTSSGYSLNDLMCRGPNLQQDLQSLILKWRQYRYAFTADIEKMFRKIWLNPEDQKYQKIIWRNHHSQPLKEYQLATVTYGTKAAPFLAMMTLKQLANDERPNYPNSCAPDILENSFYMDDLMHGEHSASNAKQLKTEMMELLKAGGFNLRKWRSNLPEITDSFDTPQKEDFDFKQPESTKTLGLRWEPKSDYFIFHPIEFLSQDILTKRQFLSQISKIFDPLGWLAPVTIKLKILFQELWKSELGWDQPLPEKVALEWNTIKADLSYISQFRIPRWILTQEKDIVELHGFCDASTKAYACVVYCKIQRKNETCITLIAGKSKVIPLKKPQSIPILELSGAVLLSKLMRKIILTLTSYKVHVYGWIDSMAALGWLNGEPEKWKPIIANRVRTITEIIPKENWRYVKSKENPADCASRSISAEQLTTHSLWWQGPNWLAQYKPEKSPKTPIHTYSEELEKREEVNSVIVNTQQSIINQLLIKYSSMRKVTRVLAYINKFIDIIVSKKKHTGFLTLQNIRKSREMLIKHVQNEYFSEEISRLKNNKPLSKKSRILNLNPILDTNQVLRVGGRLQHSNLDPEMKHPIIIPNQSKLADLIIDESHELVFHGGVKMTAGFIRHKYWILGGNRATKKRVRMCVKCKRNNPVSQHQIMGDLPPARLIPNRPFYHTGIDFTGHIFIKANKGRGIKTCKGYIAVFVCMVTKAIHLEIVSDLTTSAFIAALRRMAARRGVPGHIYSDQGSNFIGANKILKQELAEISGILSDQDTTSAIAEMNIEWHFNAPSWPSAGGLWEAAVKSLKHHLKRVVGEQKLTYEEYTTLLSQLEACLNSRPLCSLTDDPEDLNFLTPAHFLASGPILTIFETEKDLRTRWHLTQKIYQDIWAKWKTDYLIQLSTRAKWRQRQKDLELNDIVIIKDDNLPPGKWNLGRVVMLHPGSDGHVRVVTLKTKNGHLKRPVVKLSLLPTNKSDDTKTMKNEDTDLKTNNNKPTVAKKNKPTPFSAIVLSLSLFLLSLINTVEASYNFTQLTNNSVYFDKITNMHLIRDNWHLIVYYDTNPYQEGIAALLKYIQYLETVCPAIRTQTPCDGIMLQLAHEFEEIKHYNNIIMINDSFMTNKRRRRGLIDGVGYVANSLFGVLDQRFAEKYEKDIDLLKNNENHLYNLWKNQTSVVEAEFNVMKRMESTINKHHKLINQKINYLKDTYENLAQEVQNMTSITDFLTTAFTANNLLYTLRRIQDSILDTVTDIYSGKLDFHIISPKQLRSELSTISAQISGDLVVPVDNFNLKDLYSLLKVRAKYSGKYLIIEIKIPLIERDLYEVFHLIPVPRITENNMMMKVETISQMAAINMRKDSYLTITDTDLQSCLLQNPATILCHIRRPIHHMKDDHSLCETIPGTRTCKTKSTPCKNDWIDLSPENKYYYLCCDDCNVKLLCESQVRAIRLSQAGLLRVGDGCLVKTEDFMVYSSTRLSSKISTKTKIISPEIAPINHLINITMPEFTYEANPNNSDNIDQFEAIKKSIEIMKQSAPLSTNISYHDVHQYTAIYLIVFGILVLAAAYCFTLWRRQHKGHRSTPAAQRSTASATLASSSPNPVTESVVIECSEIRANGQCSNKSVKSGSKNITLSSECLQKKEDKGSSPIFRVFSLPDLHCSNSNL